jgi:hypothetical protein
MLEVKDEKDSSIYAMCLVGSPAVLFLLLFGKGKSPIVSKAKKLQMICKAFVRKQQHVMYYVR